MCRGVAAPESAAQFPNTKPAQMWVCDLVMSRFSIPPLAECSDINPLAGIFDIGFAIDICAIRYALRGERGFRSYRIAKRYIEFPPGNISILR